MGEECLRDELRTLFLFEHLTDDQLDMLCADGSIETFPAGPLCVEGEPASCFYVMLDGELITSSHGTSILSSFAYSEISPGFFASSFVNKDCPLSCKVALLS